MPKTEEKGWQRHGRLRSKQNSEYRTLVEKRDDERKTLFGNPKGSATQDEWLKWNRRERVRFGDRPNKKPYERLERDESLYKKPKGHW